MMCSLNVRLNFTKQSKGNFFASYPGPKIERLIEFLNLEMTYFKRSKVSITVNIAKIKENRHQARSPAVAPATIDQCSPASSEGNGTTQRYLPLPALATLEAVFFQSTNNFFSQR